MSRQISEFKVSLVYIASTRVAQASETPSQKKVGGSQVVAHAFNSNTRGGRGRRISVSSRSAWSKTRVLGSYDSPNMGAWESHWGPVEGQEALVV